MAIRVAVDARQRSLGIVCCRNDACVGPACPVLLLEWRGQSSAGESRFPERADAPVAQLRNKRSKDPRRGNGILLGRMTLSCLDTEPRCQALDGIFRERWFDDFGQQSSIERPRLVKSEPSPLALALKHGEIETNTVADDHDSTNEINERRPDFREAWCSGHLGVIDVVDRRCRRWNGDAGRNQTAKYLVR